MSLHLTNGSNDKLKIMFAGLMTALTQQSAEPVHPSLSCNGMKIVLLLLAIHSALSYGTADGKKFMYLVQNEEFAEFPYLETERSDLIQLVWKHYPLQSPGVIYFPNSTILQRRNRLFGEFRHRFPDGGFTFLIMVDGASALEETHDYGLSSGNPWRTLERYLLEYEPALASPQTDWCQTMASEDPSHAFASCDRNSTSAPHNQAAAKPEVEVAFDHDDGGVMAIHAQASKRAAASAVQRGRTHQPLPTTQPLPSALTREDLRSEAGRGGET